MLRNNPKIAELMYTDAASSLSQLKGITLEESNKVIAGMSFIPVSYTHLTLPTIYSV